MANQIKKIDKTNLTQLEKSVIQKADSLLKIGFDKYGYVMKETARLQDEARASGMPEKDVRNIKAEEPPYIVSYAVYNQYVAEWLRFARWVQEEHPAAHKIQFCHQKGYDREYLNKYKDNVGTQKTKRSQMVKLMGVTYEKVLTIDEKRGMPEKGRDFNPIHSPEVDAKKFGDVITDLTRITGARDIEVGNITPSCFRYKSDGNMYCHFDGKLQDTKGGRNRDALVLPENVARIKEICAGRDANKPIIEKVPSHFYGHAYRRLYAADIYHHFKKDLATLIDKRVSILPKRDYTRGTMRTSAPAIYHSTLRNKDYDRKAMEKVVEYLGHGNQRTDLVVKNYADYF